MLLIGAPRRRNAAGQLSGGDDTSNSSGHGMGAAAGDGTAVDGEVRARWGSSASVLGGPRPAQRGRAPAVAPRLQDCALREWARGEMYTARAQHGLNCSGVGYLLAEESAEQTAVRRPMWSRRSRPN